MKLSLHAAIAISLLLSASACTRVHVQIPDQGVMISYSYPVFQEKFFSYKKTSQTLTIEFKSESDPLVRAMETITELSSKAP